MLRDLIASLPHAGDGEPRQCRERGHVQLHHSVQLVWILLVKQAVQPNTGVVDQDIYGRSRVTQVRPQPECGSRLG